MDISTLYNSFKADVNREQLLADIAELTALELPQTHSAHRAAAARVVELARAAGLERVEAIELPEDGESVFYDRIMPYAWEASLGRLTVVKSPLPFADPVIADYSRHPFHLMTGSPSLPEGGKLFNLVEFNQMLRGADVDDGTLVLLPSDQRPRGKALRAVLELGAAGVVCDYLCGREETPECICWFNGNTPSGRWGLTKYDPPYIGFGVSPQVGAELRRALELGPVTLRAESDGHFFADTVPAVTGVLPGRDDQELWLLSHLYEPLADDNSIGVVTSLEIVKILRKAIDSGAISAPQHTLRVVFARELHGFAAFLATAKTGTPLGAINIDSSPKSGVSSTRFWLAPPNITFGGNALMRTVLEKLRPEYPGAIEIMHFGFYSDDTALSGSGVPTIWPLRRDRGFWHNSTQTIDRVDPENCAAFAGLAATWSSAVLTDGAGIAPEVVGDVQLAAFREIVARGTRGDDDQFFHPGGDGGNEVSESAEEFARRVNHQAKCFASELCALRMPEQADRINAAAQEIISAYRAPENLIPRSGVWFDLCKSIFLRRTEPVLPYDMARDPEHGDVFETIYLPIGRMIANADRRRSLAELLAIAEAEGVPRQSETELKRLISDFGRLGRLGYLEFECERALHLSSLREELQKAGISRGDVLMVHSALGAAGPLADHAGAAEVNDLLLELIGEEGTLLMPAFTTPSIYFEGDPVARVKYRPASPETKPYTGALVNQLLTRPGCIRDPHITHSVAGIGRDAAEMLSRRSPFSPPTGLDSVWPQLVKKGGKMLFLGTGLGCTTMLHYLETELNLPYLGGALARYRTSDGVRSAWIEQHLGGCRDFYRGISSRFYQRALAHGLKIVTGKFGVGEFHLIDVREFHELARELLTADPNLLLCEDPGCGFCSRARRKK